MIKSLVKILIAVLLANALWRVASAYISYYRFQDAVSEVAMHSSGKTEEQIKSRVVELASMYDEPIDADAIAVRKSEQHTYVDGTYTKSIALFPGYQYQWQFVLKVDGFYLSP